MTERERLIELLNNIDDNRYTEIPFVAYGKTVFLTKEEAEKALKARGKE